MHAWLELRTMLWKDSINERRHKTVAYIMSAIIVQRSLPSTKSFTGLATVGPLTHCSDAFFDAIHDAVAFATPCSHK